MDARIEVYNEKMQKAYDYLQADYQTIRAGSQRIALPAIGFDIAILHDYLQRVTKTLSPQ